MSKNLKLNDRQERFCLEYVKDLNATQAAIRAGYSENAARNIGCENLTKPNIQKRLAELQDERSNDLKVDARYVLNRLLEIDQMDVLDILNDGGALKPVKEWPSVWRTSLSGLEVIEMLADGDPVGALKKIKWPDKVKNLELLGKHIDVGAFQEIIRSRQEIEIKDFSNMTIDEASDHYRKLME